MQLDLCIDQCLFGFGLANDRSLQAFLRLLLVGNADRALLDALPQITHQIAVEGHIVLGRRHDTLLQQDIEILPRNEQAVFSDRSATRNAAPSVRAACRISSP